MEFIFIRHGQGDVPDHEHYLIIKKVTDFKPEDLSELLAQSTAEGFRHINRLINDYITGINKFHHEDEALFECRLHNRVVGICGLNRDPYSEIKIGRVRRLLVLKEFRRYGVGRRLTDEVINTAKSHYRKLVLKTDNPNASEFYKALGFKEVMDDEKITHYLDLS